MLTIGNITLDVPFFQAPMSGYSDLAMRNLARRYGCPLCISGLLLDKMILHPSGVHQPLCRLDDDEHPVGAQLLGNDPHTMAAAAVVLRNIGYDLIDLNFCCPAPKVVRKQRGGFLLTQPALAIEIAQRVRDAVPCAVTLKLRTGHDNSAESFDHFSTICRHAETLGIDALVIHGRSVTQRFHDRADWNPLIQIKKQFPGMPIFGSGDLITPEIAAEKIQTTPLNGVAIARGAIGNPWFFADLRCRLAGKPIPAPPAIGEVGSVMLDHIELLRRIFSERKALINFRKFCPNYARRHPQRKIVLLDLIHAPAINALVNAITYWYIKQ